MICKVILLATSLVTYSCSGGETKTNTEKGTDTSIKLKSDFPDLINIDSVDRTQIVTSDTIRRIDSVVKAIDADKNLKQHQFSITALKKVRHLLTYNYNEHNGVIKKIQRQFSYKKDTVVQVFYMENNQLIYATETITTFHSADPDDTITWAGYFYFYRNKLIDYTTLGHGKSEQEDWNPENGMLQFWRESLRDIKRVKGKGESER